MIFQYKKTDLPRLAKESPGYDKYLAKVKRSYSTLEKLGELVEETKLDLELEEIGTFERCEGRLAFFGRATYHNHRGSNSVNREFIKILVDGNTITFQSVGYSTPSRKMIEGLTKLCGYDDKVVELRANNYLSRLELM